MRFSHSRMVFLFVLEKVVPNIQNLKNNLQKIKKVIAKFHSCV